MNTRAPLRHVIHTKLHAHSDHHHYDWHSILGSSKTEPSQHKVMGP